jgi:hypothetical protein
LKNVEGERGKEKINMENELTYEYRLEVYRVVEGSDLWPLVETIVACDPKDCIAEAERKYNQDEYHWTNPTIA